MELTAEEEIMAAAMRMYTGNTSLCELDFSKRLFDNQKLMDVIRCCKNAGMLWSLMRKGDIVEFPKSLLPEVESLYQESVNRDSWLDAEVAEIVKHIRQLSVKCVIGGSYVILREICGLGELFVDELVLYLDRDIDLSQFSKDITITKIIKDEQFFSDYFSKCLLLNFAPLDVMYADATAALIDQKQFNDKHVAAYILHHFYTERCRLTPFTRTCFSNPELDAIFEEKHF